MRYQHYIFFLLLSFSAFAERPVIIVTGGYYGSALKDTSGERVWITGYEGTFGSRSLVLENMGFDHAESLSVDGLLLDVPILFGLFKKKAYGPLARAMKKRFPEHVIVNFGYDWRQGYLQGVKELDKVIENLNLNGHKDISLIAHSQGGLLAAWYLRYGTQRYSTTKERWDGFSNLNNVIFITSPFGGTIIPFRNMMLGVKFGLNKTLISPQAVSSFASSTMILPWNQHSLVGHERVKFKDSLWDFMLWQQNLWGLMNPEFENAESELPKRSAVQSKYLTWGSLFYRKLHGEPKTDPLPKDKRVRIFNIKSSGFPTLAKMAVKKKGGRLVPVLDYEDGDEKYFEQGDQTLTLASQELPQFFKMNRFQLREQIFQYGHSEIHQKEDVHQAIEDFLKEKGSRD